MKVRANLHRKLVCGCVLAVSLALVTLELGAHAYGASPVLSRYLTPRLNNSQMDLIATRFEIVRARENGYEVIVPADDANEFLSLSPTAKLLEADISASLRGWDSRWQNAYHDFAGVENKLREVAENHSDLAKLDVYGRSKEGRPLYVLKLSDHVDIDEPEAEIMITAATHGNEIITVELVLGLIDRFVTGYADHAGIRSLVDENEIFFIPIVNADGFVHKTRYANGVDPNREYPSPIKPHDDPNECIAALIDFFEKHDIKGTLDFHSYGNLVMYPWAYTRSPPQAPDNDRFIAITSGMAALNQYEYGQIAHLVWPVAGSSADYYYWKNKTMAIGVELGEEHAPDPSVIPALIDAQTASTVFFIEQLK